MVGGASRVGWLEVCLFIQFMSRLRLSNAVVEREVEKIEWPVPGSARESCLPD